MIDRCHVLTNIYFHPTPPINFSFYSDLAPYRQFWMPPYILCPSWWVGGGGCYCHYPLVYLRFFCLYFPVYHQRDRLFHHHILRRSRCSIPLSSAWCYTYVPFLVSSVGSLIFPLVKFSLLWLVKSNPAYPDLAQYILRTLSLNSHMWARAGPY